MKENNFRTKLTNTLKATFGNRVYIQKHHGTIMSAGLLDLMIVLQGRTSHLELKSVDRSLGPKDVTALQINTMQQIDAAGGFARVLCLFDGKLAKKAPIVALTWQQCQWLKNNDTAFTPAQIPYNGKASVEPWDNRGAPWMTDAPHKWPFSAPLRGEMADLDAPNLPLFRTLIGL